MADYIKREDIEQAINSCLRSNGEPLDDFDTMMVYEVNDLIDCIPAADVRENVKSEWGIDASSMCVRAFCLNCGKHPLYSAVGNCTFIDCRSPFCPWCGADMRGKKDE